MNLSAERLLRLRQCVCIYMTVCVYAGVCIHMNVSCIVCMCVCVSKNKLDKTKPKQKTQNGIIMADILKNEHKLYRDRYYSDNKATFFTLSSLMFGLFFFFLSLKGFCCYCFKWQQRGGERDGGRGGVVTVKRRLVCRGICPALSVLGRRLTRPVCS